MKFFLIAMATQIVYKAAAIGLTWAIKFNLVDFVMITFSFFISFFYILQTPFSNFFILLGFLPHLSKSPRIILFSLAKRFKND